MAPLIRRKVCDKHARSLPVGRLSAAAGMWVAALTAADARRANEAASFRSVVAADTAATVTRTESLGQAGDQATGGQAGPKAEHGSEPARSVLLPILE